PRQGYAGRPGYNQGGGPMSFEQFQAMKHGRGGQPGPNGQNRPWGYKTVREQDWNRHDVQDFSLRIRSDAPIETALAVREQVVLWCQGELATNRKAPTSSQVEVKTQQCFKEAGCDLVPTEVPETPGAFMIEYTLGELKKGTPVKVGPERIKKSDVMNKPANTTRSYETRYRDGGNLNNTPADPFRSPDT
ncbi:MAG: hypothetical protein V4576_03410, partial [Patescibacteria group bacterium]